MKTLTEPNGQIDEIRDELSSLRVIVTGRSKSISKTEESELYERANKLCGKANEHIASLPQDLKDELKKAFIFVKTSEGEVFCMDI